MVVVRAATISWYFMSMKKSINTRLQVKKNLANCILTGTLCNSILFFAFKNHHSKRGSIGLIRWPTGKENLSSRYTHSIKAPGCIGLVRSDGDEAGLNTCTNVGSPLAVVNNLVCREQGASK